MLVSTHLEHLAVCITKDLSECIAAFTSRPLMILTSSDIGTDSREVESNLTSHFKRAQSWGAVLLIDEADVFMERRTTSDFARNSLVAGNDKPIENTNSDSDLYTRIFACARVL